MAYWFTTDATGKPIWVIGEGPIVGNRAVLNAVLGSSAAPTGLRAGVGQTHGLVRRLRARHRAVCAR
jgi:hypothetical protein